MKRKKGSKEPATSPRQVQAREREREVLRYRRAGHSLQDIAETMKLSREGVRKILVRALELLEEDNRHSAGQLKHLEIARIDAMQAAVWKRALGGPDVKPRAQDDAIDRVIRCSQERSKLLGLHAPVALELTGRDGEALRVEVDYLTELDDRFGRLEKANLDTLPVAQHDAPVVGNAE